ncbi:MAG TPA: phospholipid carrier-dependent glycosyltransferase [Geomonas sp.]|nr:phospholipid carrier-dependent glycosyltransferase [Geomonas sp.]
MRFFRDEQGSAWRDLAALAVTFGVLFFQFLGRLPLIDPDEGRYVEIPREMIERGDFVTPMLNYVKYFEKPPLHYWLNALSLTVFGENEFAARFAGTMCGLLTVLLTYWLGRQLFGRRSGLYAATLLGTALGFLVQSRINFTDMTLTFTLSAAFACFLLASREDSREKARYYYLFYLFMALAVLAKGLIGIVLPGGVIFLYLLATRRWRLLKEMRIPTGTLLFLLVCAPWFVLVSMRNPEFPHFFFIHEHFQRFLSKVHRRYQPLWFFIPVLIGTMMPWSLFIPAALGKGWRERKAHPEKLFLFLWAALIFAFFSKSNSKLIPYILPVIPPLAVLMGNWFAEVRDPACVRRYGMATGLLLIVVGGVALGYPLATTHPIIGTADGGVIGGLFIVAGIVSGLAARSGDQVRLLASLAASAYVLAVVAPPLIYDHIADYTSAKGLSRAIEQYGGKDAKIACLGDYQQGIAFYTHRRVILVGERDELDFGSRQGDNSGWFVDPRDFMKTWNSGEKVFMVVKKNDLPSLKLCSQVPVQVLFEAGERLLVANHPVAGPGPQSAK